MERVLAAAAAPPSSGDFAAAPDVVDEGAPERSLHLEKLDEWLRNLDVDDDSLEDLRRTLEAQARKALDDGSGDNDDEFFDCLGQSQLLDAVEASRAATSVRVHCLGVPIVLQLVLNHARLGRSRRLSHGRLRGGTACVIKRELVLV